MEQRHRSKESGRTISTLSNNDLYNLLVFMVERVAYFIMKTD